MVLHLINICFFRCFFALSKYNHTSSGRRKRLLHLTATAPLFVLFEHNDVLYLTFENITQVIDFLRGNAFTFSYSVDGGTTDAVLIYQSVGAFTFELERVPEGLI